MAVRASIATGSFTAAATWGTVDATSYLNSENATESNLTTAYSGTRSSGFTPGAIEVSHICVKLCERIASTGSMSVSLRNATLGLDDFVTGTEVVISNSDLPTALEADINGGWIAFKLAAPVTLLPATSYNVQAKASAANLVDLWTDGTVDNLSRALITTTTGTPAAGDDLIVLGDKTGSATGNNYIVYMDNTATTDFGAASTSLVTPSLAICDDGTLRWPGDASQNYYLKQSGNVIVYSGGSLEIGTTGTPIARTSTATLLFDCVANVDFGLVVRNGGTFISQGLSRTSGKLFVSCLLNADVGTATGTTLAVDTDTGWLDNDAIAVASTTRTAGQCESGTLNGNAGAATLIVDGFTGGINGGVGSAHSGTSPTQAEVILLTRNVVISGTSTAIQAYVDIKATAVVDIDWTEFKWLGSATANKRGIDTACTTGVQSWQYCSLHDFQVASSLGLNMTGASGTGLTFSNNVTWMIANYHFLNVANSGGSVLDTNIFMRNTDASTDIVVITDIGGTFTNITIVGATANGLTYSEGTGTIGTWSNIISHSNGTTGVTSGAAVGVGTISTLTSWRNGGVGLQVGLSYNDVTISNCTLFGNTTTNLRISNSSGRLVLISPILSGDSTFSTTNGILTIGISVGEIMVFSGDFGTVTGIKIAHTNDINISAAFSFSRIFLNNTKLASATEVATQTNLTPTAFISSQKHDKTAGLHKTWKKYGTIAIETGTTQAGSYAFSMTPNNASFKLESGSFYIAVGNTGSTTPSVYVRENGSYNGNRSRLVLKRNDAIGVSADTVIATSTGTSGAGWVQLTGTTGTATDDGVMEFVVDCDGTAGILYVDTFSAT